MSLLPDRLLVLEVSIKSEHRRSSPSGGLLFLLGAVTIVLGLAGLSGADAVSPARTAVSVGLRVFGAPVQGTAVKFQGVARWFGKESVEPVPFSLETGGLSALRLRPGRWVLEADAKDYW